MPDYTGIVTNIIKTAAAALNSQGRYPDIDAAIDAALSEDFETNVRAIVRYYCGEATIRDADLHLTPTRRLLNEHLHEFYDYLCGDVLDFAG